MYLNVMMITNIKIRCMFSIILFLMSPFAFVSTAQIFFGVEVLFTSNFFHYHCIYSFTVTATKMFWLVKTEIVIWL